MRRSFLVGVRAVLVGLFGITVLGAGLTACGRPDTGPSVPPAWLRTHATEHAIDPDRILLFGHSAGAYLAALLSTDERFLQDEDVPLESVLCTSPLDTEGYDMTQMIPEGGDSADMFLDLIRVRMNQLAGKYR